jgi:hypothetical protein
MSDKKLSATLHRRGGVTMSVEVPQPLPDAITRPAEVPAADGGSETPSGQFGERLFRLRSSDDGSVHYIQDHYRPEPELASASASPARCSSCGRARSMFFVKELSRTADLTPTTERLCVDCYTKQAAAS